MIIFVVNVRFCDRKISHLARWWSVVRCTYTQRIIYLFNVHICCIFILGYCHFVQLFSWFVCHTMFSWCHRKWRATWFVCSLLTLSWNRFNFLFLSGHFLVLEMHKLQCKRQIGLVLVTYPEAVFLHVRSIRKWFQLYL